MKGKIITIEGLDGCGKSTQISLLQKYFAKINLKHKFIHYPKLNEGVYGELIAEYLRGEFGSVEAVNPKIVGLLFALDRLENKSMLNTWLEEGYCILMDRYVKSNIAFQCAKVHNESEKAKLKDWINNYEFAHNKLPKPALSFFLNVPFEIIEKSLLKDRTGQDRKYLNGKKDIHEDSLKLQKEVLVEYFKMVDEESNFININCADPNNYWLDPETIHTKIKTQIENILANGHHKVSLK
ncbi:hypothetical protein AAU57_09360 [Nonlabens sp. YIK11]|uniref:dTMP kinase n=1 Tax=Nonlabens sp. YIK11 TaxID=1453349 RepID=UPI0006DC76C2|nr:hypothetical protein [Nonlabens sp. YIK11]KQC33498.1 hypothetical protein AAU57_09360 [Nonlabens sp. YIK11]